MSVCFTKLSKIPNMYFRSYQIVQLIIIIVVCKQGCGNIQSTVRHFDLFSSLLSSCPALHILCIQFSFNLLDIY